MDVQILAKRLKEGDENALSEIIREFSPVTASIIYNMSSGILSKADIEEVLSDTFTSLWFSRDKIIEARLAGYICVIAKNKTRDKMRRTQKSSVISIEDIDIEDRLTISKRLEQKNVNELLSRAVNELEDEDRRIIIMHYFYYLTAPQIAEKTGINVNTVKTKIRRSREKIRQYLKERGVSL